MGIVPLKNAGIMSVFRSLFKSEKDGQTIHRDLSGFLLKLTEYPKRMDIRPWQAARVNSVRRREGAPSEYLRQVCCKQFGRSPSALALLVGRAALAGVSDRKFALRSAIRK
ncbi:MAG TPA: hypothetical protein VMP00_02195 [Burkholderiales bacterium]|nr:hypothetical protein [Burkholderiales bacterium]